MQDAGSTERPETAAGDLLAVSGQPAAGMTAGRICQQPAASSRPNMSELSERGPYGADTHAVVCQHSRNGKKRLLATLASESGADGSLTGSTTHHVANRGCTGRGIGETTQPTYVPTA